MADKETTCSFWIEFITLDSENKGASSLHSLSHKMALRQKGQVTVHLDGEGEALFLKSWSLQQLSSFIVRGCGEGKAESLPPSELRW